MLAEITIEGALTIAVIIMAAILIFWILHKIVKFILSLVIVLVIAIGAIVYCVHAGYLTRETAAKLNPLNSEEVRQTVKDAGAWAGAQAKGAVKKAVNVAIDEMVGGANPTNNPAR